MLKRTQIEAEVEAACSACNHENCREGRELGRLLEIIDAAKRGIREIEEYRKLREQNDRKG